MPGKAPSVISFGDIPEEPLRSLELFLGQDGLKDKIRRNGGVSFSSTQVDFAPLSSVIDLFRESQDEIARLQVKNDQEEIDLLTADVIRLQEENNAITNDLCRKIGEFSDRLREITGKLEAAKGANALFEKDIARLKDMLSRCAREDSILVLVELQKEISALLTEV